MAKKSVAKRSAAKKAKASEAKPETTKSMGTAISGQAIIEARAKVVADNRWATLKQVDEAFDKGNGRKEVINISIMDPNMPPEINPDLLADGHEQGVKYSVQQVAGGVMIGMREGGSFESVDGFGWKDAADKAAHGSPLGAGATRLADVGAA